MHLFYQKKDKKGKCVTRSMRVCCVYAVEVSDTKHTHTIGNKSIKIYGVRVHAKHLNNKREKYKAKIALFKQ